MAKRIIILFFFSLSLNIAAKTNLKVLTYNVWNLFLYDLISKHNAERLDTICSEFKKKSQDLENGYDIILIQEKWMIDNKLKNCGYFVVDLNARIKTGLLILSRYKIINSETARFHKNGVSWPPLDWVNEAPGKTRKGILSALIDHPQGNIWVVNTHLVAGYSSGYDYTTQRRNQMGEVFNYIKQLRPKKSHLILGGDFNAGENALYDGPSSTNGSNNWDYFKWKASHTKLKQISEDEFQDTFSSRNNFIDEGKGEGKIDHLFFDEKSFSILGGNLVFDKYYNIKGIETPIMLSDHFGWEVEVQINFSPI